MLMDNILSKFKNNNSIESPGWLLLFAIVLMDSLGTYFGQNLVGVAIPVNALLPLWLLIMIVRVGVKQIIPPMLVVLWLTIAILGFLIGIMIIPEHDSFLLFKISTALVAFIIGFGSGRWNSDEGNFIKLFLVIGGGYVLICAIAVLKLAPSILPVVNDVGNYQGKVMVRPSVTIDQNFQIFYVFMPALVLVLRFKTVTSGLALFFTLGALLVLAKLQTRSGVLLIGNIVLLTLLAPLRFPELGRKKVIVLPIVILIFIALTSDQILESSQEITQRFTREERFNTILGRLHSAQYLFDNLLNSKFWMPHGEADYIKLTGNIPHFTPTAFYLHGGALALMAWVAIFAFPLFTLARMFLQRKLDNVAIMIFIGAITSFIAQLSLNAPYFEQTWLWAGAAIGVLNRQQYQNKLNRLRRAKKSLRT
jgi:hypothetical protein